MPSDSAARPPAEESREPNPGQTFADRLRRAVADEKEQDIGPFRRLRASRL